MDSHLLHLQEISGVSARHGQNQTAASHYKSSVDNGHGVGKDLALGAGYYDHGSLHGLEEQVNDLAESASDSDGEPQPKYGKKTRGRVRIKMQFINNKLRRYTTFSKRKTGIMKKAYELSTLTGTQVMLLVASETGHVYTFATKKLQPMITSESGKALIQTCLNSPDNGPITAHELEHDRRMNPNGFEETELSYAVPEDDELSALGGGVMSADGNSTLNQNASNDNGMMMSQSRESSNSSTSNTFNLNTIIPPTSNSDGTMGKVTNLTLQLPQSSIHSGLSNASNQSATSVSSNQMSSSNQQSLSAAASNRARIEQQNKAEILRQREEIERLEQQQLHLQLQGQQHQQQLRSDSDAQQLLLQQLSNQAPALQQLNNQPLPSVAPAQPTLTLSASVASVTASAATSLPSGSTPSSSVLSSQGSVQPLLYQTSTGQTVVYTPTAALGTAALGTTALGTLDLQPFLGIPTLAAASNLNTSNTGAAASQYITIPVSLANQVLTPVVAGTIEAAKKT